MKSINQVTCSDNVKLTTIDIGRGSREWGNKLAAKLNDKTFMHFEILVCPAGGECAISAQTTYNGTVDEILGMFIYLMATEMV